MLAKDLVTRKPVFPEEQQTYIPNDMPTDDTPLLVEPATVDEQRGEHGGKATATKRQRRHKATAQEKQQTRAEGATAETSRVSPGNSALLHQAEDINTLIEQEFRKNEPDW